MWVKNRQLKGFTIVELLIVIVVIAILAAITIVAFSGVQSRARDSTRKSDLSNAAKQLKLYLVTNGDSSLNGCGNANSLAWFASDYDGAGPNVPVNSCLTKALTDPSGLNSCSGATCHAYLKVTCADGVTYLFANLELEPQSATATDSTCATTSDTLYGSNYFVRVN